MNNFVFSQDPLLYSMLSNKQNPQNDFEMKKQLDEAMSQYYALSQQNNFNQNKPQKDYLGEIDDIVKGLDENMKISLSNDIEYIKINEELQRMIQEELMKSVKWKINNNPEAITKMERLRELINNIQKSKNEEDKRIMADINDYITNYSDLTFEEYKKLKYGK